MHTLANCVKKIAITVTFFGLIFFQTGFCVATLPYDDGDCDADGVDLHRLIVQYGDDPTQVLSFFSNDENVAFTGGVGAPRQWYAVNLFLCDAVGGICATDAQPANVIGHRINTKSPGFTEIGGGFAVGADAYWVQDFNGVNLPAQPPVADANHALIDPGTITFYLNDYDRSGSAPRRVNVVLDGEVYNLDLGLGSADAGAYQVTVPGVAGCRGYYFLATDGAGDSCRYPGSGVFHTFGVEGCGLDYMDEPT